MPTRDDVRKLFPEIDMIRDTKLREQTADVWVDALRGGGWEIADMAAIPFTLLIETKFSLVEHTRAVTRTAMAIADTMTEAYGDAMPINRDHLIAGGILHDVGKLLEYRKEGGKVVKSDMGKDLRHPFSGTALAYAKGLPSSVCHLIAVHAKEGDGARRNPEAFIIHHADFANFESLKVLGGK
jgi:putative nucleotidyltransferase with HDIG domain